MAPKAMIDMPYTHDTFGESETSFTRTVEGKRYIISSSGTESGKHAAALFTADDNKPGEYFWNPGNATGGVYYKGFDGTMRQASGQWVQIKLPAKQTLVQYTCKFNIGVALEDFTGDDDNPPSEWVVLGSDDGSAWTVIHEETRGASAWVNAEYESNRNGAATGVTGSSTAFQNYRIVFTSWSAPRRLDRLDLFFKEGGAAAEGSGTGEEGDAAAEGGEAAAGGAPGVPPGVPAVEEPFYLKYKWYLLGAAIVLLIGIVMFMK